MARYDDIHPDHIDPETNRPYAGYSSPALEPFTDGERPDRSERAWFRYVRQVERALGITNMDGDERLDGYSLDSAYDAFEAGIAPPAYANGRRA